MSLNRTALDGDVACSNLVPGAKAKLFRVDTIGRGVEEGRKGRRMNKRQRTQVGESRTKRQHRKPSRRANAQPQPPQLPDAISSLVPSPSSLASACGIFTLLAPHTCRTTVTAWCAPIKDRPLPVSRNCPPPDLASCRQAGKDWTRARRGVQPSLSPVGLLVLPRARCFLSRHVCPPMTNPRSPDPPSCLAFSNTAQTMSLRKGAVFLGRQDAVRTWELAQSLLPVHRHTVNA